MTIDDRRTSTPPGRSRSCDHASGRGTGTRQKRQTPRVCKMTAHGRRQAAVTHHTRRLFKRSYVFGEEAAWGCAQTLPLPLGGRESGEGCHGAVECRIHTDGPAERLANGDWRLATGGRYTHEGASRKTSSPAPRRAPRVCGGEMGGGDDVQMPMDYL